MKVGIGTQMVKLYELRKLQTEFPKAKISKAEDGYKFIKQFYGDDIEIYESFFILLMNRANQTIGYAKISQGGITGTVVDTKIIAKYAVDCLASGIVLAHNHPSGNLQPSTQDLQLTKKLTEAMKLLDVSILDHLIITTEGYYSFVENGKM
jgi:DNA repair protein RadC